MSELKDLQAEREYTKHVQQLLLSVIDQSAKISDSHSEAIRMMIADAWEELRMRPTALSTQELEQLSTEMDRFEARKSFSEAMVQRYRKMLMNPFFARVDFAETGEKTEKIVIGLYSLKDRNGDILVHDWRAPVCSLYYDSMPGECSYNSPSGIISGNMSLKRQYRMEKGQLMFYVDTSISIDDSMLLDILSGATSRHMKQIVSTIQSEQNAAIRHEQGRVVSVVGGAGSGKTSVAMHRAAYLMYRQRDTLDASRIQIISPSPAFSEYVSTVLPELGEENIRSRTMCQIVEEILGKKVEKPLTQVEQLLNAETDLRGKSVKYKCGKRFLDRLEEFAESFAAFGPDFGNVRLDGQILIRREELRKMYKNEFSLLSPAQRLTRVKATLDSRISSWEESMYVQYEHQFEGKYSGKELKFVCQMAVSQRLQPVKHQLRNMLDVKSATLMRLVLKDSNSALRGAFLENMEAGLTWWEDAVAEAYLMLKLGFVQPDKSILHLLVDECQDYSETALALMHLQYPNAKVTLLGDPKQRTCPNMPACDPSGWGACFGEADAALFKLSKCYRSTLPIARLCNAILPGKDRLETVGREGEMPEVAVYSMDAVRQKLDQYRSAGHKSIAVITRTHAQSQTIAAKLQNVYRLDGGEEDWNYETDDTVVGSFQLMKGMEFDAVIVAWPDCELTDDERRRLYTACSRALHAAALLADERLLEKLGIVL